MADLVWKLRLAGEEWKSIGDDENCDLVTQAADEIARLREALEHIARLGVDMRADFSRSAQQSEIARAALQHKEPQP